MRTYNEDFERTTYLTTRLVVLVLGNRFNLRHLRLEWCHGLVAIAELADVNVTEITWWSVGSWTWSLESLGPLSPATDTERWGLSAMEFCADMALLANFTRLFVLTGSRIFIYGNSWSEKSVMRW